MTQKLIVGVLVLTVIGAVAVGLYDANRQTAAQQGEDVLANYPASDMVITDRVQSAQAADVSAADAPLAGLGAAIQITPTPVPGADNITGPVQQQQALSMVGDPWTGNGTIVSFTTAGMTLALDSGEQIYVELGPSYYWQSQGVSLAVDDWVTVSGFFNGDQYHAATVTKSDGSQVIVRTAEGLPLWSGGNSSSNGNGGNGNGSTANGTGQAQVAAEDWLTISGIVVAVDATTLTVQATTGETLVLQLGRADFWQAQGITFAAGDEIEVLGFWQGVQFQAGEIVKLATGERLMLRDPNGRPLSAGPGRAGQGGQGGQGQATQSQTSQGQGQGQGGGSRGYRGGR